MFSTLMVRVQTPGRPAASVMDTLISRIFRDKPLPNREPDAQKAGRRTSRTRLTRRKQDTAGAE